MGNKQQIALENILDDTQNDQNMKTVFKKYDKDGNKFIDKAEFQEFLKEIMSMIQSEFDKHPDMLKDPSSMSKERIEDLMKKKDIATKLSDFDNYDDNKDGKISYDEFKTTITRIAKQ